MHRVRLIHGNAAEAAERAAELRAAGYDVDASPLTPAALRDLRADPPAAVVIDLSRVPSQGRDVALSLRITKATRQVPILFVSGAPAKVARVRELLPDATYTRWSEIVAALPATIAAPPADPVVPESTMAGYSGTPLPRKLGIGADARVVLVGAPQEFEATLGSLPPGVVLSRQPAPPPDPAPSPGTQSPGSPVPSTQVQAEPGSYDVALWFVRSQEQLTAGLAAMDTLAGHNRLWILWPKKASGVESDLTQSVVRAAGLAAGLVDYKVAAIDQTWSGLLFTRRKSS